MAEQALSDVIETIHDRGGASIQADLPVSLKAKLAYAKRAAKLELLPTALASEMLDLVSGFEEHRELRHDLTHGFMTYDPRADEWQFVRTRYRGPHTTLEERVYEGRALVPALERMDTLVGRGLNLRDRVWEWAGIELTPDAPLVPDPSA